MPRYTSSLRKATDNITCMGSLTAATASLRRGNVQEVTFGCSGTPADSAFRAMLQRCTTVGTGTAKTPKPTDPGSPAAGTVATHLMTADATLTAGEELLDVAMNQRTTFRWVANPGNELWWPATNLSGIAAALSSASSLTWNSSFIFEE